MGDKIKSLIDEIANMGSTYSYDQYNNLEAETYEGEDGKIKSAYATRSKKIYRRLDDSGRIHNSQNVISDYRYTKGGRLIGLRRNQYVYNDCGDLVEKKDEQGGIWKYEYTPSGLLETVTRPDGQLVSFAYDPVGRRVSKEFDGKITRYVWDGNRILHEWQTVSEDADTIKPFTWLYSGNTFTPIAKLTHEKAYSVITDHLGTPTMMINNKGGQAVWKCKLNIYGQERIKEGGNTEEENCNFRYPGQYEDVETGLYYNRFRYYDPDMGGYTQRDPIGLSGGNPTVYGYVWSTLLEVDEFGLMYRVNTALPRNEHGVPIPISQFPHTQIGEHTGRRNSYRQTREWGANGELIRDIDWTDHGRPQNHTNPHQHTWEDNTTGGSKRRGEAQPCQ